ncbi:zinc-dependent alcohol dehydrogenase family protein [candidate division WOR-3 bacterium]|nr:zinc-dependent alcohol dehydrogenase family protein [candidate division WOR-3 bacterium]
MKAMVLERVGEPLKLRELPIPEPSKGEVQIKIHACGVCRTDLHIYDGELKNPKLPLILGHEIVGTITKLGDGVKELTVGERIGVPWLGKTDGTCSYCDRGLENLCENAEFTGYTRDGGYAEYTVADHHYCFPIPDGYSSPQAAPLLCAGLIGYRSYKMTGDAKRLGLYGFGAAAHIIAQVAQYEGREVYAFTRPGDEEGQEFAKKLGAIWADGSLTLPPVPLNAAIIFAPVGNLVPQALKAVDKGGRIICAGIHMSDIPSFPYKLLWEERCIKSVANLTREDGLEFFAIAPEVPVKTEIEVFKLEEANEALDRLRNGEIKGAAVLEIKR